MKIPILNVEFNPRVGNERDIAIVALIEEIGIASKKLNMAHARGVKRSKYDKDLNRLVRQIESALQ